MTQKDREQIAAGRFHIIAAVVNRAVPLQPGEVSAWFREAAFKTWTHEPYWLNRRFGYRTLERWKQRYERMGIDGLKPAEPPKRPATAIPESVLQQAEAIRREMPQLSVDSIRYLLHKEHGVDKSLVTPSTLSRHFRRAGLTRQRMANEKNREYGFRRFEAEAPMQLWQSDFHHTLHLEDPANPNKRKLAKLCLILDDHSRFVVHAQYYWDEKMPRLEDCLKKAIEKHGIPNQFYCDNGSAFSTGHMARICARLGIRLSHSKPYRPMGRGKVERIFEFVDSSFRPIALNRIVKNQIRTLDDLNRSFQEWLAEHYHIRTHSETKETPLQRMSRHPVRPLPYGKQELRRFFFIGEIRKVDKAGTLSLDNVRYQVPSELVGLKVEVRYDPYDPGDAEVHVDGRFAGLAIPTDPVARFRKHFRKGRQTTEPVAEPVMDGQLVFTLSGKTEECPATNSFDMMEVRK